jgi:hypothetical protein
MWELQAMSHQKSCAFLLTVVAICCLAAGDAGNVSASPDPAPQNVKVEPDGTQPDLLKNLASSFPDSITLKRKGHLLEFCPDNTCDGFASSASVPVSELKDFAYLYIYFFSDFYYLPDWRTHADAKDVAERILAKPKYRGCKGESNRQTARSVLLQLSRGRRIKLMFIRYDENARSAGRLDIPTELSKKPASAP